MFPGDLRVLVWDVDGVLFYVGDSYRKAIVSSVQFYFSDLMGLGLEKELMDASDTQRFKYVEGFNDDWKLTYACVLCFLADLAAGVSLPDVSDSSGLSGMRRALKSLGDSAAGWTPGVDIGRVTRRMSSSGKGLSGVEKALSELYGEDAVVAAKRFWYTDVIKRVFQEYYLGEELYRMKYSEDAVFLRGAGFIRDEKPLVSVETLEKLSCDFYMGIASGRERFELDYSLKAHGFSGFFPADLIVSSEEVTHGKPDPSSLLLCRKRVMGKYGLMGDEASCAYVGDSVDDIRASKRAGFYSIGALSASSQADERERLRREFVSLGCDLIIGDVEELGGLV